MRSGSPEPRSIVVGGPSTGHQQPRPTPARALSEKERDKVFDTLCSERFVDRSPAEVVATLLDEDVYLCSERTMYRVLASQVPVRERRAQRSHPEYQKPELMATGPGEPPPVDLSLAGSAKLGALDRSQGRSGVSPFGAPRFAPPGPRASGRPSHTPPHAATPPSAASRAPPRPAGYGHRRQGPSATYRHGQGAPPHRPYGQSGGPGAKHSAYALSDTSGRVSLHRLARARASPAGTP